MRRIRNLLVFDRAQRQVQAKMRARARTYCRKAFYICERFNLVPRRFPRDGFVKTIGIRWSGRRSACRCPAVLSVPAERGAVFSSFASRGNEFSSASLYASGDVTRRTRRRYIIRRWICSWYRCTAVERLTENVPRETDISDARIQYEVLLRSS